MIQLSEILKVYLDFLSESLSKSGLDMNSEDGKTILGMASVVFFQKVMQSAVLFEVQNTAGNELKMSLMNAVADYNQKLDVENQKVFGDIILNNVAGSMTEFFGKLKADVGEEVLKDVETHFESKIEEYKKSLNQ